MSVKNKRLMPGGKIHRDVERAANKQVFTPEEAMALCKKMGVEYLDGYEARIFQYVLSDETYARDRAVLKSKGLSLKNYLNNPVVLRGHNPSDPIGMCLRVWYEKATEEVKAWVLFLDDRTDRSGLAESTFRLVQAGVLKASSIGFDATTVRNMLPDEKVALKVEDDYAYVIDESELYELSIVSLPANVNALKEPITRGLITREAVMTLAAENKFADAETAELIALLERAVPEVELTQENVVSVVTPTGTQEKGGEWNWTTTPSGAVMIPLSFKARQHIVINMLATATPEQAQQLVGAFRDLDVTLNMGQPVSEIPAGDSETAKELASLRTLVAQLRDGKILSVRNKELADKAMASLRSAVEVLTDLIDPSVVDEENGTTNPGASAPVIPEVSPAGEAEAEKRGLYDFELLASLEKSTQRIKQITKKKE